ncbi:MAG: translation initiation factor IF-2 [Rhodospirillaceae bacterium]|nr:translation initiation factor IF-2 [Rhodospirillaceae bacterium]
MKTRMPETKETDSKKPLTLSRQPGRLELKKTVDAGIVKQSFSHGRSKQVSVEVKRKRTFTRGDKSGEMTEAQSQEASPFAPSSGHELTREAHHALSDTERLARMRALEEARRHEPHAADAKAPADFAAEEEEGAVVEEVPVEELEAPVEAPPQPEPEAPVEVAPPEPVPAPEPAEAAAAPEPAAPPVEERPRLRAPVVDAEQQVREQARDAERQRQDELARQLAAQQVGGRLIVKAERPVAAEESAEQPAAAGAAAPAAPGTEEEDDDVKAKRGREKKAPAVSPKRTERRRGKLTINQAIDEGEGIQRVRSMAAFRRAREKEKRKAYAEQQPQERKKVSREVVLPESISVQELANRMAEKGADVVKILFKMGVMATVTQSIDADTAELVAAEMGHRVKRVSESDVELGVEGETDDPATLQPRPPVVTVMGHVDHGKTSLLDALRKTDVAAHEAGGITQHIGAYQVKMPSGAKITFLDTPGHAAFTQMRARGAKVTDIVVLVVAADDGVQPQTIEAIAHAKAAGVPMIVAVNKVDKPDADPRKVRQALLQHEVVVEELGGETIAVDVSAIKGTNLDKLEENILLQAEVLELKANPDREAQGTIVEAKLDRGRGPVATALVQKGTLKVGNIVVAGNEWGRARALTNDRGEQVKSAGPSEPVEILGLQGVPLAGDPFSVVADEARAREITEYRKRQARDRGAVARGTIEQMFSKISEGAAKELGVVIKSDVQGSSEAIVNVLEGLSTDAVKVRVLHSGVGGINESDITLAKTSGAFVIGFNVRASAQARDLAQRDGVDIRYYSIIYDIADDVRKLMTGLLAPVKRESFIGYAQILQVFKITKSGNVAGCKVTEGVVRRGCGVRLLRDNVVIHEGKLSTLKRFKDEVREVKAGMECGMAFENYQDIREGDQIECFVVEEVAATL